MREQKKAIVYCRVTTRTIKNPKDSILSQEQECRNKLQSENVFLVDTISDTGRSGLDLYRDGIRKLLSLVRNKEVDVICTRDWTRISRNPLQFIFLEEWLKQQGVRLILCQESGFILPPHHVNEVYGLLLCE